MTAERGAPAGRSAARRGYGVLLRLAPRTLRATHGEEMAEVFLDALDHADGRGRAALARVWCAAAWDLGARVARAAVPTPLVSPTTH